MNVGAMIEAELKAARERAKQEREEREEEERKAHLRPWDRGKGEGRVCWNSNVELFTHTHTHTVIDPIRKRKRELQSERPSEFAPPAAYFDQQPHTEPKKAKHKLADPLTQDNDSGGVSSASDVISQDSSAYPLPASTMLQPSTTITMTTSATGNPPNYGISSLPPGIPFVPPPPPPHGQFIPPPLPTYGQFVTPPPPTHAPFVTQPPPHHTQFIPQPLPNYGQFVPPPPHGPIYHPPYGQFVSPPPPPGEELVHPSPTHLSDPSVSQYMTPPLP